MDDDDDGEDYEKDDNVGWLEGRSGDLRELLLLMLTVKKETAVGEGEKDKHICWL